MELPVRILFITPYPELKQQLAAIIPHYPAAKITIAEGDLGQGLIQAQRHLRPEYDAVISRGGTAELLRAAISIPVTEVEVSPYDILRALNTVGGGRAILVAHENITRSAQKLRELIDCHLEVVPLSPCSSVRDILRGLHPEGRALLCDTVAYTTALELGYHPHLVLSGDDSIRQAIDQTLLLCQARRTLSAENHFFRQLLLGQIANTVVLDDNGGLVLSSCDDLPRPLLELLRTELPVSRSMGERRILRSLLGRVYLIHSQRIQDPVCCTAFFFVAKRTPVSPRKMGLCFFPPEQNSAAVPRPCLRPELSYAAEEALRSAARLTLPLLICGETGSDLDAIISRLARLDPYKASAYVSIRCSALSARSWSFLLEHHGSPLADSGQFLWLSELDVLSPQDLSRLLTTLSEMAVCRRNCVVLSASCVSATDPVPAAFYRLYRSLPLMLPPLRLDPGQISALAERAFAFFSLPDLPAPDPAVLSLLQDFPWPGNDLQFLRVLETLVRSSPGGPVTAEQTAAVLRAEVASAPSCSSPGPGTTLEQITKEAALQMLHQCGGNRTQAALHLGIGRTTLWRILRK